MRCRVSASVAKTFKGFSQNLKPSFSWGLQLALSGKEPLPPLPPKSWWAPSTLNLKPWALSFSVRRARCNSSPSSVSPAITRRQGQPCVQCRSFFKGSFHRPGVCRVSSGLIWGGNNLHQSFGASLWMIMSLQYYTPPPNPNPKPFLCYLKARIFWSKPLRPGSQGLGFRGFSN